jgi:hypothetical protein
MIAPVLNVRDEDLDRMSQWLNPESAAKMLSYSRTSIYKVFERGRIDCRVIRGKQFFYMPQVTGFSKPPMGNPDKIKSDDLYISKESQLMIRKIRDQCKAEKDDAILAVRIVGKWVVLQHSRVIDNKQILVKQHKLQSV